ncbi:amino acid adenylation domain-containing protein [Burkholderia cenocepacia]|uniref:amino acid adenylation domain-containing protein n=1 Tax=Burkholderia cenocepacia TaxID=95486 RepID=UPI0022318B91|nr:amino acid adenylation domain-containing protein [Burkholderia cenocepacia]MCW3610638.1 amino acid adenylation domain-containing protein [Burkholderia cenocepacia]MCW5191702.1 amino acid adenylation domain-containing protein [Burkholderia cenocepacia]
MSNLVDETGNVFDQLSDAAGRRYPAGTEAQLSMSQEQAWFLEMLVPDSIAYNFQAVLNLRGALDIGALERALGRIVERHQSLSTVFVEHDGEPVQRIEPAWPVTLPLVDLSKTAGHARDAYIASLIRIETGSKIDVGVLPLLRWVLFKRGEGDYALLHIEHHLIHDGWSFRLFMRELSHFYNAERGVPGLAPLDPAIQFIDYCAFERAWLETETGREGRAYWRDRLQAWSPYGHSPFPRADAQVANLDFVGSSVSVPFPAELAARLKHYAAQRKATLFETMFSVFASVVAARSGNTRQIVGTAVANRDVHGIQNTIGMLVNMLPMCVELSPDLQWPALIDRVKDEIRAGCSHSHVPFSSMVADLQPERVTNLLPYIQVAFSFHNSMTRKLEFDGLDVEILEGLSNGSAKFDLNVIVVFEDETRPEAGGRFMLEYSTSAAAEADAVALMNEFFAIANAWLDDPDRRLGALSGASAADAAEIEFWRAQFATEAGELIADAPAGTPPVELVPGRADPAGGAESRMQLNAACEAAGIAPAAVSLALHAVTVARFSGNLDVVIGLVSDIDGCTLTTPLPVALHVDPSASFSELAAQAERAWRQAAERYARAPHALDAAIAEWRSSDGHAVAPRLQSTFGVTYDTPATQFATAGRRTRVDARLSLAGDGTTPSAAYASDGLSLHGLASFAHAVERLVDAAALSLDMCVGAADAACEPGGVAALRRLAEGARPPYREATLHAIVERWAAELPDAPAVRCGETVWTYAELDAKGNEIAAHLLACGVRPGEAVGVSMARSPALVGALLGILKAGACYLSLDAALPSARREWQVRAAAVAHVLVDADAPAFPEGIATYRVDRVPHESFAGMRDAGRPDTSLDSPCYFMFTSGSTGEPKATPSRHRDVVNFLTSDSCVKIGQDDRVLMFAPLAFDASTFEIWGALLNGAQLIVQPGTHASLEDLADTLVSGQASVVWLTSALFQEMVVQHPEALRHARQVLTGGDVVSTDAMHGFFAAGGQSLTVCYGPTEGTVFTTAYTLERPDQIDARALIGRPISHRDLYVIDVFGNLAAEGVPGELYVGGGVTDGYLQRPDLTAERFVSLLWLSGHTLFRSGDIGRWSADGRVEFLGRRDNQIKIRGFRIETGEIEQAIRGLDGVAQCAVVVAGQGPDKRLEAFVTAARDAAPSAAALRDALVRILPDYMVPARVQVLERLPMTASGKLDKRALLGERAPAQPEAGTQADAPRATPNGELEGAIAAVWADVLKLDAIEREQDFFAIGGHSLAGMRIVSRLGKTLGRRVSLDMLFRFPTVASLAAALSASPARAASAATSADRAA